VEAQLISLLLGSLTGIVLALTGAGGTIIAVPLLIFGLHLTIAEAAPVALLAVSVSAAVGALFALMQGKVRYRAAGFVAVIGAMVSPFGVWLAQKLPNAPLTLLFAVVLTIVAVNMLRQTHLHGEEAMQASGLRASTPCLLETAEGRLKWTWSCARALALAGALAGFLSGLLGVGGGFVIVPALKKVTNFHMQSILATSLAIVALISAMGVTSAAFMGGMDWSIALPFTAGALAGMLVGRIFASRLAGAKLQQGFAVVAIAVSVGMVVKLFLTA